MYKWYKTKGRCEILLPSETIARGPVKDIACHLTAFSFRSASRHIYNIPLCVLCAFGGETNFAGEKVPSL